MKQFFTLFSFLLVLAANAQSDADLLKMERDPMRQLIELGLTTNRDGEIGFNCSNAIPLVNSNSTYQGQINNGNAEVGPPYGCLATQPNPTWFKFRVAQSVPSVSIIMYSEPSLDIDYALWAVPADMGCVGLTSLNSMIACSYSTASVENATLALQPGLDYFLLVTNFSNQPCNITIEFQNAQGDLIFVQDGAYVFSGSIYNDSNSDCVFDSGEETIGSGVVHAVGTILSVPVQADGTYTLALPSYNNQLFTYSMNNNYGLEFQDCNNQSSWTYNAPAPSNYTYNFGVANATDCALPVISNHSSFARRCFTNGRIINYSNLGSQPLNNAFIKLTYDLSESMPISISQPFTQSGNDFIIQLGNLAPFQSGSIQITDSLRCENGIGSSVTVTAQLLPIPDCLPFPSSWDQSDLLVSGTCAVDNIVFQVQNIGSGNMASSVEGIVYANSMPIDTVSIQLLSGQTAMVSAPSQPNTTYTLVVNETANHPFNQSAWASGECYSGEIFAGIPPFMMPQDQQPYIDQDVQLVIGAYDPNDKNAVPFGLTDNRYIRSTDELEYTIRFQNTGTDTAFNIVIKDVLEQYLNPESIQLVGASHAHTYLLQGNELTVQFPLIMLPDSASNPEGSIGYIKFKIKQVPDPLYPTQPYTVNNHANIFFDFNLPITTNVCQRTVPVDYPLSSVKINSEQAFTLYPNPTKDVLTVARVSAEQAHYMLTDLQGRQLLTGQLNGETHVLDVKQLSSGVYLLKVLSKNGNQIRKFVKE